MVMPSGSRKDAYQGVPPMRRLQKIIQQRRRQLHVHIPPSELKGMQCGDGPGAAKTLPPLEVRQVGIRRAAVEGSITD